MALQRNLKDQISRLKVEELTLLSLISSFTKETNSFSNSHLEMDITQPTQPIASDFQSNCDSDENISLQELRSKRGLVCSDKISNEVNDLTHEQSVNRIPIKFEFNSNDLPSTSRDSKHDFEEEHYENEHDDEEDSEEFV